MHVNITRKRIITIFVKLYGKVDLLPLGDKKTMDHIRRPPLNVRLFSITCVHDLHIDAKRRTPNIMLAEIVHGSDQCT